MSNEKTLKQHCNRILPNIYRFQQKVINKTFLKDTPLGITFQRHQSETFKTLFLSVKKRTIFIHTMKELTVSNEAAQHIQRIQDITIQEMKTQFLRLEVQFEGQKPDYVELESNKTLKDFLIIKPGHYAEAAYLYSDKSLHLTSAGDELTSQDVDTVFYLEFEKALDKQDKKGTVDLNKGEHPRIESKDSKRANTKKLDIGGTIFGGFNSSEEENFYNLLRENGLKKGTANIVVVHEGINTIEKLKEKMPTLITIRNVRDVKIEKITTVFNKIETSFKDSLIEKGFSIQLIDTLVDQNNIVSLEGLKERLPTLQETNVIDVQEANNLKTVINQIETKPVLSNNRAAFPRTQSAAQLLIKTLINLNSVSQLYKKRIVVLFGEDNENRNIGLEKRILKDPKKENSKKLKKKQKSNTQKGDSQSS